MNLLLVTISVFSCFVSNILGYPVHNSHHDEISANIDYSVQDIHTGDVKQHYEVRDKDFVLGTYSLAEPDGTYRIVEYEAYPHKGFNAVVKRIGKAHHPQVYHNGEEHHKNEEHHNIHHNEVGEHLGESESHISLDSDIGEHLGKIDGYVGDDNEIGEHYGEAESHVGVTHWGHQ